MLKTNENQVVEFWLQCQPGPPRTKPQWRVSHEGEPFILPGIGGITLNVEVGDSAFGWAADHKEYKLDKLRFGDFVALLDHDNSYGRAYKKGAISIGIVVHSDCLLAGHGPGVTTVMTCPKPMIEPAIDVKANIADLLNIGNQRIKAKRK